MTITISGAKQAPQWVETEKFIGQLVKSGERGKLIRISRNDRSCDYRGLGAYSLTYLSDNGETTPVKLEIIP